jgi:hypothetical protein
MNERERNYVVVTLASKTEHITHENNTNNNNNKGDSEYGTKPTTQSHQKRPKLDS